MMMSRSQGCWVWNILLNLVEINPFDLSYNYWSIHACDDLPLEKYEFTPPSSQEWPKRKPHFPCKTFLMIISIMFVNWTHSVTVSLTQTPSCEGLSWLLLSHYLCECEINGCREHKKKKTQQNPLEEKQPHQPLWKLAEIWPESCWVSPLSSRLKKCALKFLISKKMLISISTKDMLEEIEREPFSLTVSSPSVISGAGLNLHVLSRSLCTGSSSYFLCLQGF